MDDARLDVEYDTKLACPEDTGELVNSIHADNAEDTGFGAQFELFADAPHAVFIVEGTRDHGPVTAKVLHWGGKPGIFAHWVRGVRAHTEFWSDDALQERLQRALENSVRSVVTDG